MGFGLIYLPAIVTVNYYFESRRALATGIAVCGSGFGTFVFAPFSAFLLREYGWKGGNMILAGIIFNAVVSWVGWLRSVLVQQLFRVREG